MPVDKQIVSFPLVEGLDTKTDPNQLATGQLIDLENGVFDSPKRIGKRFGFSTVGNQVYPSGTIGTGIQNAVFNDEYLVADGQSLYSNSGNGFVNKGPLENWSFTLQKTPGVTFLPDYAIYESIMIAVGTSVAAASGEIGIYYSISDLKTGQVLTTQLLLAGTSGSTRMVARVVNASNYFTILVYDTANPTNLNVYSINALSYLTSPVLLVSVTDLDAQSSPNYYNAPFDMCPNSATNPSGAYLAYGTSTGSGSITVIRFTGTSVLGTKTLVGTGIGNLSSLGVSLGSGARVHVAVVDSSANITLFSLNQIITTFYSTALVDSTASKLTLTMSSGILFYEIAASGLYSENYIKMVPFTDSGSIVFGTITVLMRSVTLQSKPFANTINSDVYLPVAYIDEVQNTYFVINVNTKSVVATIAPSYSAPFPGQITSKQTSNVSSYFGSPNAYVIAACTVANNLGQSQSEAVFLSVNQPGTMSYITAGKTIQFAGGVSNCYDGSFLAEQNFFLFPGIISINTASSGGTILAGTYSYVAAFQWTDANGQVQISAPSVPLLITTTGSTSVNTIIVSTLRITAKTFPSNQVLITLYRTLANGTAIFLIGSAGVIVNDVTIDYVTFTDTLPDSDIDAEFQLYTNPLVPGSAVENSALPATKFITTYKNRAVALTYEDPNSFWYSKEIVSTAVNSSPIEFSQSFVENITPTGGAMVAATQMDDKFILLKNNDIFYIVGDGPAPNGTSNDFSNAQIVTTDTGCNNPSSIVVNPLGVMFQGPKGVYLLDRSLAMQYIGAQIEAYNSTVINSAILDTVTRKIYFLSQTATWFVYDYFINKWSLFLPKTSSNNAVASCIYNGSPTFLDTTGISWTMQNISPTPSSYSDGGNFVGLKIQTGPITFAGVQGFQRIFKVIILGQYYSPHLLQVTIQYDYNSQSEQIATKDIGALFNQNPYGADPFYGQSTPYGGQPQEYQFEIDTDIQKCEAIQITIQDVSSGTSGQSFSLSSIAFEVGVEGKGMRLPSGQRFS